MRLIAIVSPPTKSPGVPSNCEVGTSETEVTLTDDTGSQPFTQRGQFDEIYSSFHPIIDSLDFTTSSRIISICGEFSTPKSRQISNLCSEILPRLCPKHITKEIPLALGFVYDNSVTDFLSIGGLREKFDQIACESIDDGLDLLECAFTKSRRLRDSVFVFHFGDDPFFEWVIVPNCDTPIQTTALSGLLPHQKLLFVLNQHKLFTKAFLERNRRLSSAIRLVADSFYDIPTKWVFHISTGIPFKSNAALFRIANSIRSISRLPRFDGFARSDFFASPTDADSSASSIGPPEEVLSPEQLHDASELQRLLNVVDDDLDSADGIRSNRLEEAKRLADAEARAREALERKAREEREAAERAIREAEEERERQRLAAIERAARLERERIAAEEAARRRREEEEAARRAAEEAARRKREEDAAAEEAARRRREEDEAARRAAEEAARRKREEDAAAEEAERRRRAQEEAERRRREEEEAAAARAREEAERKRRLEEEIARKRKEEEDRAAAEKERIRLEEEERERKRREEEERRLEEERKALERAFGRAALKKWEQLIGADEELSDESEEQEVRGRKVTAAEKRERHFLKMKLLVLRARNAAKNGAGIAEMTAIQEEIRKNLGDVDAKRSQTQEECKRLAELRRKKRLLVEQLDEYLRDVRHKYLKVHDQKVQRAGLKKKQSEEGGGGRPTSENDLTIRYLRKEIRRVRKNIVTLQLREKSQATSVTS